MREIPALFNGEMVRAILANMKTATRRTRGLDEINREPDAWTLQSFEAGVATFISVWGELRSIRCPYGEPGDRLWVREAFFVTCVRANECGVGYRANHPTGNLGSSDGGYDFRPFSLDPETAGGQWLWANRHSGTERWIPSIHMPRWASRLTLQRVGEARPERLQSITEEQARAEGITVLPLQSADDHSAWWQSAPGQNQARTPRLSFAGPWDSINENRGCGWDANPYVWVIEFKRTEEHHA